MGTEECRGGTGGGGTLQLRKKTNHKLTRLAATQRCGDVTATEPLAAITRRSSLELALSLLFTFNLEIF